MTSTHVSRAMLKKVAGAANVSILGPELASWADSDLESVRDTSATSFATRMRRRWGRYLAPETTSGSRAGTDPTHKDSDGRPPTDTGDSEGPGVADQLRPPLGSLVTV